MQTEVWLPISDTKIRYANKNMVYNLYKNLVYNLFFLFFLILIIHVAMNKILNFNLSSVG